MNSNFDIDLNEGGTTVELTLNGKQHGGKLMQAPIDVSSYFARKAWPTRIMGSLLLVLASPLILLLVLIVRLTSPGPGMYRQARTGRYGKEFMMYKVRTMYSDAEKVSGPIWSKPGDSRITPVGKFLRFLHLDELPQLINVARGEMDLVGPRPERPCFVAWLAGEIPEYMDRLLVLPGVTGLAQVNLPPDEELDCVRKKVVLDCSYITAASIGLDVRIVLCSMLRMFGIRHGRAVRWLRLERQVDRLADGAAEIDDLRGTWSAGETETMTDTSFAPNHCNGVAVAISNGHAKQNGKAFETHNGAAVQRSGQRPR